ncbi:MAG: hypothetical protein JW744_03720 [Candidatus Diapherotrites archaeon]|uniref:Uncharacterized protein n=1 Tax=Candidatus Iainarchaeum sp. TaxID=3101447 RepID=A0A939CAA1_9ARCH|nr:hypothetical protein [Candidatus Diapherotrites archaeon]
MRKILLLVAIALMLPAAFGQENSTELTIDHIHTAAIPNAYFDFSFTVGNMAGPACDSKVEYWLGTEESRLVEGTDTLFLGEGTKKTIETFLLVPASAKGVTTFYLQMQCNGSTALASRTIRVEQPTDTTPKIIELKVLKNTEDKEFDFGYTLKSYQDEAQPARVEEVITSEDKAVWKSEQFISLAGTEEFARQGPLLPPGAYTLTVLVTRDSQTSASTTAFEIEGSGFSGNLSLSGILSIIAIGMFSIIASVLIFESCGYRLIRKQDSEAGSFSLGTKPPAAPAPGLCKTEEIPEPEKNYVGLSESESSGMLEKEEIEKLLDDAGFSKGEKLVGMEFAHAVPVSQSVKSCIFIDKFDKANCETTITVNIENETSNDWCDVNVLGKIPKFLSENVSEVSADSDLEVTKEGSIIKFVIPKIAASETASISYTIPKWVTQEKAKKVPLPAVVHFTNVKPLKVKRGEGKKLEKREIAEKQKVHKSKGRKKQGKIQAD